MRHDNLLFAASGFAGSAGPGGTATWPAASPRGAALRRPTAPERMQAPGKYGQPKMA